MQIAPLNVRDVHPTTLQRQSAGGSRKRKVLEPADEAAAKRQQLLGLTLLTLGTLTVRFSAIDTNRTMCRL
jgi:hypothetical protein